MAVAFVKNIGTDTANMETTLVITVPAAGVALGNFIVVRGSLDAGGAVSSIVDTGGNTYTERSTFTWPSGSNNVCHIWTAPVTVALTSGNTITITFAKDSGAAAADEWSGVGTYDGTASDATGTSTTPSSNAFTPAGAGLVIGGLFYAAVANQISAEDSDTNGGGSWSGLTFVGGAGNQGCHGAYKITTSAASQTYDPTLSISIGWGADIVAFNQAASGSLVFHRVPHLIRR